MGNSILVPMDGSPLSKRALRVALTEHPDAEIVVLHVIDPTEPGYSYYPIDHDLDLTDEPLHGSTEWFERADEYTNALFSDVREIAAEHDADVRTESIVGIPDRTIVEYVDENDIDQIVMGSHGRDEDSRILLGSVSEQVAFRAPVRVTLVR